MVSNRLKTPLSNKDIRALQRAAKSHGCVRTLARSLRVAEQTLLRGLAGEPLQYAMAAYLGQQAKEIARDTDRPPPPEDDVAA